MRIGRGKRMSSFCGLFIALVVALSALASPSLTLAADENLVKPLISASPHQQAQKSSNYVSGQFGSDMAFNGARSASLASKEAKIAVTGDGSCVAELKPEPSEAYTCSGGRLFCPAPLQSPYIVVPNTNVWYSSNVSATETLTLEGLKSKMEIWGCLAVSALVSASIKLNPLELDFIHHHQTGSELMSMVIIEQKGKNCPPIQNFEFTGVYHPRGCQRMSLQTVVEPNQVSLKIEVTHGRCMVAVWLLPSILLLLTLTAIIAILVLRFTVNGRRILHSYL